MHFNTPATRPSLKNDPHFSYETNIPESQTSHCSHLYVYDDDMAKINESTAWIEISFTSFVHFDFLKVLARPS
jgi:hypothetical protein